MIRVPELDTGGYVSYIMNFLKAQSTNYMEGAATCAMPLPIVDMMLEGKYEKFLSETYPKICFLESTTSMEPPNRWYDYNSPPPTVYSPDIYTTRFSSGIYLVDLCDSTNRVACLSSIRFGISIYDTKTFNILDSIFFRGRFINQKIAYRNDKINKILG